MQAPGRAMTRLDSDSAEMLAKLCGMFGSDHVGERAAAAAKANQFLHDLGLTWRALLVPEPDHAQCLGI